MDDIDIMPDDSLSQFSAMANYQEIDESSGTHGTVQTLGGNLDRSRARRVLILSIPIT